MDYIYSTLCNSGAENPFDYKKFSENKTEFFVGATDAITGKAYYFTKSDMKQDYYDILKASCSLPAVNKPYFIKGKPYYDGGISEPVPYKKAFADGCDKLVIALTRPRNFRRSPLKNQFNLCRKVISSSLPPVSIRFKSLISSPMVSVC